MRIRAAETEYELEREELNILNLREEIVVLQSKLQESLPNSPASTLVPSPAKVAKTSGEHTVYNLVTSSDYNSGTMIAVTVQYSSENPPFNILMDENNSAFVDWATDDTKLKKDDR